MIEIIKKSSQDLARETGKENLRDAPRRRQFKSAKLVFNDLNSKVQCRVRDMSATGAGIECDSTANVPDHLVLNLGDGKLLDSSVAWRTENRLGLHFMENKALDELTVRLSALDKTLMARLLSVIELAESAAGGARGKMGSAEMTGDLQRLAEHGQGLLASIHDLADEYGGGL